MGMQFIVLINSKLSHKYVVEMQTIVLEERGSPSGRVIDTSSDWLSPWATGGKEKHQHCMSKDKKYVTIPATLQGWSARVSMVFFPLSSPSPSQMW